MPAKKTTGKEINKNEEYIEIACSHCGGLRLIQQRYSQHKSFKNICLACAQKINPRLREKHPNFINAPILFNGYRLMPIPPNSPFISMANHGKARIFEHRLVMAQYLGRCLTTKEIVHHKNGDKLDNRIENLELTSPRKHLLKAYETTYTKGFMDALNMPAKELIKRGLLNAVS